MSSNFITSCVNGDAITFEIDKFIKEWNEYETNMDLHEYLGFTEDEYDAWLVDSRIINAIVAARIEKVDFQEKIMSQEHYKIAARGEMSNPDELKEWLISEGTIIK